MQLTLFTINGIENPEAVIPLFESILGIRKKEGEKSITLKLSSINAPQRKIYLNRKRHTFEARLDSHIVKVDVEKISGSLDETVDYLESATKFKVKFRRTLRQISQNMYHDERCSFQCREYLAGNLYRLLLATPGIEYPLKPLEEGASS